MRDPLRNGVETLACPWSALNRDETAEVKFGAAMSAFFKAD